MGNCLNQSSKVLTSSCPNLLQFRVYTGPRVLVYLPMFLFLAQSAAIFTNFLRTSEDLDTKTKIIAYLILLALYLGLVSSFLCAFFPALPLHVKLMPANFGVAIPYIVLLGSACCCKAVWLQLLAPVGEGTYHHPV